MNNIQEMLIKKNISRLDHFKESTSENNIERNERTLNNMNILIGTINDLISVINLRIDLNEQEKECIKTIEYNINDIKN